MNTDGEVNAEKNGLATIEPAPRYLNAEGLGVVACYFNPGRFRTKRENFEMFAAPIRAGGLTRVFVECAFEDTPFDLPKSGDVLRIRGEGAGVMFQKERLLNIAARHLPEHIRHVAWLDADVLFAREDWAIATSAALERDIVVQPFSLSVRLPRGAARYSGCGKAWPGFAAVYNQAPSLFTTGRYDLHGHVGFAWAARRTLFESIGLRDVDPNGHADHLMAHAMVGDWSTPCCRRLVGLHGPYAEEARAWARRFYAEIEGRLGAVKGALLHLWHGRIADRRYYKLALDLRKFNYYPARHLRHAENGLWAWADDAAELGDAYQRYFLRRREDV